MDCLYSVPAKAGLNGSMEWLEYMYTPGVPSSYGSLVHIAIHWSAHIPLPMSVCKDFALRHAEGEGSHGVIRSAIRHAIHRPNEPRYYSTTKLDFTNVDPPAARGF